MADQHDLRLALSIPNMAAPDQLVDLGVRAESSGWDGVFLWDHVHGDPSMPAPMADPWVVLGVLASRTDRITIGTAITPIARRQPRELARQTVTVDHLSNGRLVLGVGLGEPPDEYTAYGEDPAPARLASRLDEGLAVLSGLWSGEPFDHEGEHFTVRGAQYLPVPVQQPRIPVWAGCTVPHTAPLRRAARWDGVVLASIDETGMVQRIPVGAVRDALGVIADHRDPSASPLSVAVGHPGLPSDEEREALCEVGVNWCW